MEEKVQTAAETVINASAADETVTGGTTPSEPLSEKRIVHAEDFDPLFAMSEEDCVEGFIKREMQRAGITEEQNLIPEDMLHRKNILNAVLAVLLFVYISLFFFHFPMKTYVIGLLILVVYAFLTSRYQLIKYLKKEIRSRSQEKISNIVMNVKASMVPDYSKKLKWALKAVAVAGSLLLFRVAAFLDEVRQKEGENTVVFAHGGVLICAQIYAKLIQPEEAFQTVPAYGGIFLYQERP